MTYTIDERNAERQQLLAACLNPLTCQVLERIPSASVTKVLDLGCGQGNTTRMLGEQFPKAYATGLEFDPALVALASANPGNGSRISFVQGDAAQLTYPSASFDLVFTRYLLVHMADPVRVIREMLRVVRPGGFVVAYEPDCCMDLCYPPNAGMERMALLWGKLFPHPLIGRQLVHLFRAAGAGKLTAGAILGMEFEGDEYRRLYRLSAEAIGPAIVSRGVMTEAEYEDHLADMRRLEADSESVCFKLPDMWVIANA